MSRFADATSPDKRSLRSMVRRLAVAATSRVLWQLTGVRNLDGTTEALSVEVFPGIGFYARPPAGSKPEAVVVNVGGANAPAAVATRDEQTRKAVADLAEDEAAMFNSTGGVFVKADGTIEARSVAGTAVALAIHDALTQLADALDSWVPVANDGGAALKTILDALILAGWPGTGTTKLRGE